MRILLTDFHKIGAGQVEYVLALATLLRQAGDAPTIGCRQDSRLAEECRKRGLALIDQFHFRRGFHPLAFLSDLRLALRLLRRRAFDIVHVNGSQDHWTFALAKALTRSPVALVRTRHNTYTIRDSWMNRLLNRCWTTRTITVCSFVARERLNGPPFEGHPIDVIHNGVDPVVFEANEADRSVREALGIGPEDIVIGIVARLVVEKGHRFLFEAVATLVREGFRHLKLLVVGEGTELPPLQELAERLGIADRVIFTGFRNDVRRLLGAVDIGVLPSIGCDTSSIALKEMMAMEKPVICSDHGGLPEIVDDGTSGFVVPAGDAGPIADKLRVLLTDPALRLRFGKAARQKVLRQFTQEAFFRGTLASYQSALNGHG